ncbi:MAG: twin-arginine translocation signal domain-containing protein [Deltaproteobacteria bacterium]|nr:MAG: twin-arginine translocation signal domain-containing protein [Deltaproteobacteria bacterium]
MADFSRRDFLKAVSLAGTAAALGCSSDSPRKLIPYLIPPEDHPRRSDLVRHHLPGMPCRLRPPGKKSGWPGHQSRRQPRSSRESGKSLRQRTGFH